MIVEVLMNEIRQERIVNQRLYKRSVKTKNDKIKRVCGERNSALIAFLVDLHEEMKVQRE
jgi:hypothetical protein